MKLKRFTIVGLAAALAFQVLGSEQAQSGTMADDVVIEAPWAPANSDAATDGFAYFTLRNTSDSPVRMIEVRAKIADIVAPGETTLESDGDVRHSAVYQIQVPAYSSLPLSPGGNVVILRDLTSPLIEGETFELRLTFYDGSQAKVTVPVVAADAAGPEATDAQTNKN